MSDLNLWPIDPIGDDEYRQRTDAVRRAAVEEGFDAILAYSTAKIVANVRYLTSYFTRFAGHQHTADGYYMFGSCAALVPVDGEPLLRTDALWDVVRAGEMSKYPDVAGSTQLGADIGREIARRGLQARRDRQLVPVPRARLPRPARGGARTEFVDTLAISRVRGVKSPAELERIRRAEQIADAAAIAGMDAVAPGVTEYEAGLAAEETLRRLGDLETAGGCIISCGPNSAPAARCRRARR